MLVQMNTQLDYGIDGSRFHVNHGQYYILLHTIHHQYSLILVELVIEFYPNLSHKMAIKCSQHTQA